MSSLRNSGLNLRGNPRKRSSMPLSLEVGNNARAMFTKAIQRAIEAQDAISDIEDDVAGLEPGHMSALNAAQKAITQVINNLRKGAAV